MAPHIIEPHPSVSKKATNTRLSTGRGGAGNYTSHATSTLTDGPTASGPASKASTLLHALTKPTTTSASQYGPGAKATAKPRYTSGGVGGAGNFALATERRMFSFDEELDRQQKLDEARARTPLYTFGRGGAGNYASAGHDAGSTEGTKKNGRSGSSSAESVSSADSATPSESAAARIGSRFGRAVRALSNSRE